MAIISIGTWTAQQSGSAALFILEPPIAEDLISIPLSVYAHSSPAHLTGNAVIVLFAGTFVSLVSTPLRFHAFFISTGVLGGVSQLHIAELITGGPSAGILGASGAALALIGYMLTANPLSATALRNVPSWAVGVVATVIAAGITVYFSGGTVGNVGYVAHFTGALLGAVAGHWSILRPR